LVGFKDKGGHFDVDVVETLACRRAISFALEIGLQEVELEGDSEVVIKHLQSDSVCLATFGQIVRDS